MKEFPDILASYRNTVQSLVNKLRKNGVLIDKKTRQNSSMDEGILVAQFYYKDDSVRLHVKTYNALFEAAHIDKP